MYLYRGQIYSIKQNFTDAIDAYKQFTEAWPNDTRGFLQLGQAYERAGFLIQATEAYESLLLLDPTRNDIRLILAKLFFKRSDYKKSIKYSKLIIQSDSTNVSGFAQLGKGYLKAAQYDSATIAYDEAVKRDSSNFQNQLELGISYCMRERYVDAYLVLKKLNQTGTKSGSLQYHLSRQRASA
ncbi:tetratricopeptide repeat protein [candidate division KSB1 bacterium]|nr:tetratricopeptide repeat protein [candidate division KSB1 bacterium]